jgi:mono/diheme cytochrome c family protein
MIDRPSRLVTVLLPAAPLVLLAAACGIVPASADPLIERGRALVEANCSACHATGAAGESPHREAPPFRTLWQRYPLDALEEAFAEGIYTGHPDMPHFIASPEQIEAIIAYISALPRP